MDSLHSRALVTVIDDDESVREALPDLLGELGFSSQVFASGEAFLDSGDASESQCLLVDVAMPGMTGPELLQELKRRGIDRPTVFITAYADERTHRQLIEQGGIAFLLKPFSAEALLAAVTAAVSAGQSSRPMPPATGAASS